MQERYSAIYETTRRKKIKKLVNKIFVKTIKSLNKKTMKKQEILVPPFGFELSRHFFINRVHDSFVVAMSYAQDQETEQEVKSMTHGERLRFLKSKGLKSREIYINT